MVKVKFYGALKKYIPSVDDEGYWTIDETSNGLSIEQALLMTNIASTNLRYSVLVNGLRKHMDYSLVDGDVIAVMPLLTGG